MSVPTKSERGVDDLLDKVRRGELTPDAAEAEAERLGLGQLANTPDPWIFDPMGETWWTLPMTLAWIAWRSPDRVRWFWDAYRLQCLDWHFREWRVGPNGPVHAGHFLEKRRSATLTLLLLSESHDSSLGLLPSGAISIAEAKLKLWQALGENRFEATGINTDNGKRSLIPDHEWLDLIDVEERERDLLRRRDVRSNLSSQGYEDVAFRRQNIMAIWQPHRLEERGLQLPPLMRPEGPGYMPLYFAAQWIATQGGAIEIEPRDVAIWKHAFTVLLARIASEEVTVIGTHESERQKVAGHLFASIRVDYPFSETTLDLMFSEELYLSSCPYIDEEHWRKGFDDHLETRWGVKWSRLTVLKSDVARHWPFLLDSQDEGTSSPTYRTGAPGRPSPMHIVLEEYRARRERAETKESVVAESKALSEWLQNRHPTLPSLTPKTIRNKISAEHRRRSTTPKNKISGQF